MFNAQPGVETILAARIEQCLEDIIAEHCRRCCARADSRDRPFFLDRPDEQAERIIGSLVTVLGGDPVAACEARTATGSETGQCDCAPQSAQILLDVIKIAFAEEARTADAEGSEGGAANLSVTRELHPPGHVAGRHPQAIAAGITEPPIDRRRVARDLHDQVGYGVNVAHRHLELFQLYRESDPVLADDAVALAERAIVSASKAIRDLTSRLRCIRPTETLGGLLRSLVEALFVVGTHVEIEISGEEGRVFEKSRHDELRHEVFLVLREAIWNAVTHSRSRRVAVQVVFAPRELWALVEDDGVGFILDPSLEGSGVASMRERTASVGGALTVISAPGAGTRVEVSVPLRAT
jgi:signal transduction histidine kinase